MASYFNEQFYRLAAKGISQEITDLLKEFKTEMLPFFEAFRK